MKGVSYMQEKMVLKYLNTLYLKACLLAQLGILMPKIQGHTSLDKVKRQFGVSIRRHCVLWTYFLFLYHVLFLLVNLVSFNAK